jgi:hypothetical protein
VTRLKPDAFRDETTGVISLSLRKKLVRSSRGESGEKEGNEVNDLSEGAMEDAELDGCDVSFFRARAVDRWLLIEVADCCDIERSRGAEKVAVVASMSACQIVAS